MKKIEQQPAPYVVHIAIKVITCNVRTTNYQHDK